MLKRTVEIVLVGEFQDYIESKNVPAAEVNAAIGYLARWAIGSPRYHSASIYGGPQGDLAGVYRDKLGETSYNIAAILGNDRKYSFHS